MRAQDEGAGGAGPGGLPESASGQGVSGGVSNSMSGTADQVLQIGRARSVHITMPGNGEQVAAWQVPEEEPGFVNRVRELGRMGGALAAVSAAVLPPAAAETSGASVPPALSAAAAPAAMVLLLGPSGVGKSALSRRFAAAYREHFRYGYHVALAEFRAGGGAVDLGEVFGALLLGMGVAQAAIPPTRQAREVLYRAKMKERQALVVVDDAELSGHVTALAPGGRGALVVTSQRRLAELRGAGTMTVEVGRLSVADGLELLAQQIGAERVRAEPEAAAELVDLCDGLPVLLRAVSAHLVARSRRRLSATAGQLHDARERTRLFERAGAFAVLDVMLAELAEPAAGVYRILGLVPATEFAAAAVGVAGGIGSRTVESGLDDLVDAGLLEEVDDGRFSTHAMIRAHAVHVATQTHTDEQRTAARRRLVEWYLAAGQAADRAAAPVRTRLPGAPVLVPQEWPVPEFESDQAALAWLEAEHAALLGCVRSAAEHRWDELVWLLCDPLWALNQNFRHPAAWIEALTLAIEAAERAGHRWVNARLRCLLSRAYVDLGRFEQAAGALESALESARLEADRLLEASVLEFTGIVELESGRPAQAIQTFDTARQVLAAAEPTPDTRRADVILRYLTGRAFTAGGNADSAVQVLEAVYPEALASDPRLAGQVRFALIEAQLATGRPGPARELAALAAAEAERRGVPVERIRALRLSARACGDAGEAAEAERYQAEAEALQRELGLEEGTGAGS